MQSVVVTGTSTGIGAGTAKVLTERGLRVFGSVRQPADGERVRRELGERFVPLLFDVTDRPAIDAAAAFVARELDGQTLHGLVNNAGIAVLGPLIHLLPDEFRRQLEVNLVGQLHVTQAFAPLLGAGGASSGPPGRIVMMSSVGGRNASPFMGPYNTSKFGLEGFSESLRRELMLFGVDVIVIAPGPVATPIWDKADALDPEVLAHTRYVPAMRIARQVIAAGRCGLPAERIGEVVYAALTSSRPRTRYVVTPNRQQQFLVDALPKRMVDRIVAKRLGWR
jgi:NAD(P)-dependent dehydrogenase (short-subunit alcohol dehydrogenase family)